MNRLIKYFKLSSFLGWFLMAYGSFVPIIYEEYFYALLGTPGSLSTLIVLAYLFGVMILLVSSILSLIILCKKKLSKSIVIISAINVLILVWIIWWFVSEITDALK